MVRVFVPGVIEMFVPATRFKSPLFPFRLLTTPKGE
jgi:hypothetical protein